MTKMLLIGCLMISSLFGGIASSDGFVDITTPQDKFRQEQKMDL